MKKKTFSAAALAFVFMGMGAVNVGAQTFEFKGFPIGGSKQEFLEKHPWKCVKLTNDQYDERCTPENFADKSYLGMTTDMNASILDGRVHTIEVDPWKAKYKEIANALTEKYGPPSKTVIGDGKEVGGQVTWESADGRINFVERGIFGNSWLFISAKYGAEKMAARRAESAKKIKQDM